MKFLRAISSIKHHGGDPVKGVEQLRSQMKNLGAEVEIDCCDAPDTPLFLDGIRFVAKPLNALQGGADAIVIGTEWKATAAANWAALNRLLKYLILPSLPMSGLKQ